MKEEICEFVILGTTLSEICIEEVVRFKIVTVVCIQTMVLRVVTPCSLLIRSSHISSSVSSPPPADAILLL